MRSSKLRVTFSRGVLSAAMQGATTSRSVVRLDSDGAPDTRQWQSYTAQLVCSTALSDVATSGQPGAGMVVASKELLGRKTAVCPGELTRAWRRCAASHAGPPAC